jgi:hypothetical protein
LSSNVDIETYAQGWLAPVHLEKLYADVLTKNQTFVQFNPKEIKIESKQGITASQVAGAVSAAIIGIGWKKVSIPTTIVQFDSCPVSFGVFSRREDFTTVNFVTPICSLKAKNDGVLGIITQIKAKEEDGKVQIEYDSKGFPDIAQKLAGDAGLSNKLLSLHNKGLLYSLPLLRSNVGAVKLEVKGGTLCFSTEFVLDHKKKKWKNAVEHFSLRPEDFVENTFNAACSIAGPVHEYLIDRIAKEKQ